MTSVARTKPRPPALTAAMTSSTEPRWTLEPRVTPAAEAIASASSAGTTIGRVLVADCPASAALTSSIGIDVRVDQKLMTGTKGMLTDAPGWSGCRRSCRRGGRSDARRRESVAAIGVLGTGVALVGGEVGGTVTFDEPTGDGSANEPPGGEVGGVDDAARTRIAGRPPRR